MILNDNIWTRTNFFTVPAFRKGFVYYKRVIKGFVNYNRVISGYKGINCHCMKYWTKYFCDPGACYRTMLFKIFDRRICFWKPCLTAWLFFRCLSIWIIILSNIFIFIKTEISPQLSKLFEKPCANGKKIPVAENYLMVVILTSSF